MTSALLPGLDLYLLIFARLVGFMLTAVPFSARNIPAQAKVCLAALIAYLLFMVNVQAQSISGELSGYIVQLIGELLVGCVIGFVTQIIFVVFQIAGQLIDTQIGFGMASVIDPQNGTQVAVLGNFQYLLALLCFLTLNGHHQLIRCIALSYKLIPLGGGVHLSGSFYQYIFQLAGGIFTISFEIALPVLGTLFITDLVLGVICGTVPQMNVFFVAMPLKIAVGLGVLLVAIPVLVWACQVQMDNLYRQLQSVLLLLKG
jgi:flagellar biosynthetic protein FliR